MWILVSQTFAPFVGGHICSTACKITFTHTLRVNNNNNNNNKVHPSANMDAEISGQLPKMTTSPPLTNFPIPRELRDTIYRLLLDNGSASDGMRYHFDNLNIFGVNKIIKKEAEELFYKRNQFVVVSHNIAPLTSTLLPIVPLLSTNKAKILKFQHCSVRIHIKRHASAVSNFCVSSSRPGLTWCLMLAEDLDVLAAILNIGLQAVQGDVIVISNTEGTMQLTARDTADCTPMSIHFRLFNTKHRVMDDEFQEKVLQKSLQGLLVAENMKVSFSSLGVAVNPALADRLRSIIGPQLVWVSARKWSLYAGMRKAKWALDNEVMDNHEDRALQGFQQVMTYAQWALAEQMGTYPSTASDSVEIALKVCMADYLVSIAFLALRLNNMPLFARSMSQSLAVIGDETVIRGLCWWTANGWSHLLGIYILHCEPPATAAAFTTRHFLASLTSKTEKVEAQNDLLLHDMRIMKERANLDKVNPPAIRTLHDA